MAKDDGRKSGAVFMRKRKGGESELAVLEYKQQKKEKIKVSPFMVRVITSIATIIYILLVLPLMIIISYGWTAVVHSTSNDLNCEKR